MYFVIEPEVSGGFGKGSVLDGSKHPPIVSKLHYEFYGWFDNDIVTSFPCYIVTEKLMDRVKRENLTGIVFDEVKVSQSYEYDEFFPGKILPVFKWMKVVGVCGKDDFGIGKNLGLVISEKAYNILKLFNISQATIEEYV